ncbi:MAG: TonB family protein [Candidatus Didemnitutus sp.]|nr:TonB family protein [Candidatus Didemnitutus sp.]
MIDLGNGEVTSDRAARASEARLWPKKRSGASEATGSWRYDGIPRQRVNIFLGMLGSVALHGAFFWGLDYRPETVRAAPVQSMEFIQIVMPPLDEEPPDQVADLSDADEAPPAVAVPQLLDMPSAVTVSTFVQPLQYVPEVTSNLGAAKITQIPVNIGRDKNLSKMGHIFEIKQLDRQPVPLLQPSPVFPYALRKEIAHAEVVVEFIVDSNGDVVLPMVVSSTHRGFEEAALLGVSKWKFRPGVKTGRKVNTRVRVPISFTLLDSD